MSMAASIGWTAMLVLVVMTFIIKTFDSVDFGIPAQILILSLWGLSAVTTLVALLIQIWS